MRNLEGIAIALLLAGCASTQTPRAEPVDNRDRHGPSDVAEYIARLEDTDRVRELDPATVLSKLALEPDAVVADLGCGPGVFALRLARAVPRGVVYAVDVEPRQLDALREELLAGGFQNVVPVLASYSTPHLPPNSCDLILISDTYHHIDDRVAYLRRLAPLLRSSGRLALLEYKPGPLPVGPPPEKKLAAGEMEAELTAAGYVRRASFDTHRYHDFEIWAPAGR